MSEFASNARLLKQAVQEGWFIRPIARHRLADGSLDVAGNLEQWNRAMEPFRKTPLWEQTPGWDERDPLQGEPYLVFVPSPAAVPGRPTLLISHGGGFLWRTGCEGPNVAWFFHRMGYNTAILSYRLRPYSRMAALADIQRAVRLLRAEKDRFGIGDAVVTMGFSAGGMLSGNCATHFDNGCPEAEDPVERFSCRPDACVVGYGAMSGVSFPAPFGAAPDPLFGEGEERFYLATEKHVSPASPPFFIWQTLSDDGRHGLCLAKALQDAGVPYELHIFEGGAHGLAMADGQNDLEQQVPHITHWGELCAEWLAMHGLNP